MSSRSLIKPAAGMLFAAALGLGAGTPALAASQAASSSSLTESVSSVPNGANITFSYSTRPPR